MPHTLTTGQKIALGLFLSEYPHTLTFSQIVHQIEHPHTPPKHKVCPPYAHMAPKALATEVQTLSQGIDHYLTPYQEAIRILAARFGAEIEKEHPVATAWFTEIKPLLERIKT